MSFLFVFKENNILHNGQNQFHHSASTIDFDLADHNNNDNNNNNNNSNNNNHNHNHNNDDNDHHVFYYTSTAIPIIDYSSSAVAEPLAIHNNLIEMTQYQYYNEYFPSTNNDINDDEDLNNEVIAEPPRNHSFSTTTRRRHSTISSNIPGNRGLHLSDILSIPQKIYSSLKEQINDEYQQTSMMINTQCYICFEDFQSTDSIKILSCRHVFHA